MILRKLISDRFKSTMGTSNTLEKKIFLYAWSLQSFIDRTNNTMITIPMLLSSIVYFLFNASFSTNLFSNTLAMTTSSISKSTFYLKNSINRKILDKSFDLLVYGDAFTIISDNLYAYKSTQIVSCRNGLLWLHIVPELMFSS